MAEEKKAVAAAENETDAGDLILSDIRPSVPLTPDNARFAPSGGGLISMTLRGDEGEEYFERVIVVRSFPISNPDEFLSVRLPESRAFGRSKEIGMIRYLRDFDEETVNLLLAELDRRYFIPRLTKILSVKEKFGYQYWEAETSAGNVSFVVHDPFSNIRPIPGDTRVLINSTDGNCFEISDPAALDPTSRHRIELYL